MIVAAKEMSTSGITKPLAESWHRSRLAPPLSGPQPPLKPDVATDKPAAGYIQIPLPTASLVALRPRNPRRPPDYHWQRALHRFHKSDGHRGWLQLETARAVRFLRMVAECKSEADLLALSDAGGLWSCLIEVWMLARERTLLTDELEARLLAGQDDATIAARIGVTPAVIGWYERLFFNVRPMLHLQAYIMYTVIGCRPDQALSEQPPGVAWKLYAYTGGPDVLDLAITGRCATPEARRRAEAFLIDDFQSTLLYKAAVSIRSLDTGDPRVALRICRLKQRYDEVQARRKAVTAGNQIDITRNLEVFFGQLESTLSGQWAKGIEAAWPDAPGLTAKTKPPH